MLCGEYPPNCGQRSRLGYRTYLKKGIPIISKRQWYIVIYCHLHCQLRFFGVRIDRIWELFERSMSYSLMWSWPPWVSAVWCWRHIFAQSLFGAFLKWGCPQIIHFNRIFRYKPSILGYPHLWNPPFGSNHFFSKPCWEANLPSS